MRYKFHVMLCTALMLAPDALQQSAGTETCRLDVSGKSFGPSADICQRIGHRWTSLLGISPIRGSIRLVDRVGYHGVQSDDSWILESPLPDRRREDSAYRKQDGILRYYAESMIPHEAGHHAFAVFVQARHVPPTRNQYSTHLPDWLDEAVAVWMESPKIREGRVRPVVRTTPSLERLATLEHPNADLVNPAVGELKLTTRMVMPPCPKCTFLPDSLRRKFQIIDSGTDPSGRQKTVVTFADRPPADDGSIEMREFYPLSYMLLRFIHERGRTAAVRELIARYRANPTPRVEVFTSLPGLPASIPAFEKAWHAFLASPPPERD